MRLTEISYGAALAIEGYGPGFFRVGPHVLRGASLITPWDAGAWGWLIHPRPCRWRGKLTCCCWGWAAILPLCRLPLSQRWTRRVLG